MAGKRFAPPNVCGSAMCNILLDIVSPAMLTPIEDESNKGQLLHIRIKPGGQRVEEV